MSQSREEDDARKAWRKSMRAEQVQKLKLVIQSGDTVMVAAGESPILNVDTNWEFDSSAGRSSWVPVLIMAMNFLRSGAPEVILYSQFLEDLEKSKDQEGMGVLHLQLNTFLRHFGDPVHYFTAHVWHGGGVIHMARTKHPTD